jgi:hypothetical protein
MEHARAELDPLLVTALLATLTETFSSMGQTEPVQDAIDVVEDLAEVLGLRPPCQVDGKPWPLYRAYLLAVDAVIPALQFAFEEFVKDEPETWEELKCSLFESIDASHGHVSIGIKHWCDGPLTDLIGPDAGYVYSMLQNAVDRAFANLITSADLEDIDSLS